MKHNSIALLVGIIIVVLAQIVIAPNIAIASVMPNFLLVFVLVVAIVRPDNNSSLILAFLLGLLFDLLGNGPVGAMSFLAVLACFIVSRLFTYLNNDTLFMPLAILFVSALIVEALYAVFMLITGISASFFEAFLYRALPCAFYDGIFGIVFYLLASRFLGGSSSPVVPRANTSAVQSSIQVAAQGKPRVRKTKKKMPRF